MYKGFNLNLEKDYSEYYSIGENLYEASSRRVENTLESFKNSDNSLDGSKLRANWFPVIQVDVFISHAHANKNKAIALSGLLQEEFGLTSFIDSCVWGYAPDLLQLIDYKYCRRDSTTYEYEKRNHSTAHVYMMLTTALASIMDSSECLFFLNTPQTIIPNTDIEKTESPWIYCELTMSRMLQNKKPKRFLMESRNFTDASEDEKIDIKYDVPLDHLFPLDDNMITRWLNQRDKNGGHMLNLLYKLNSINLQ